VGVFGKRDGRAEKVLKGGKSTERQIQNLFFQLNVTIFYFINLSTPNDDYSGRTAPLTSKCCISYIY